MEISDNLLLRWSENFKYGRRANAENQTDTQISRWEVNETPRRLAVLMKIENET